MTRRHRSSAPVPRTAAVVGLTGLLALGGLASCGDDGGSAAPSSIKLLSHSSFAASKDVLAAFTEQTGLTIELVQPGDAGEMVNQAILTKDRPIADAVFGVDNTFLSRAIDEGIFEPYEAKGVDKIDKSLLALVPKHEATPIDTGDVCINYDKAWFAAKGITPPATLDDLTKADYKDLLVVENPATSSPGLAFLLATVAKYGADGWQGYWSKLKDNGVKAVAGWDQAYSTEFSGSAGKGDRPLVVSYASSPPAEVVFAAAPPPDAPTASMTDGCFRQIEFAGVLKGTKHAKQARQLVDFLLSKQFQEDMPLNMFVYPVLPDAALPEVFTKYGPPAPAPLTVAPADITKNREAWIAAWTELVGR